MKDKFIEVEKKMAELLDKELPTQEDIDLLIRLNRIALKLINSNNLSFKKHANTIY